MHKYINSGLIAYNFYKDRDSNTKFKEELNTLKQMFEELESNYYYIKQDITAGLNGGLALGDQNRYDGTNFGSVYKTVKMVESDLFHYSSHIYREGRNLYYNEDRIGSPVLFSPYNRESTVNCRYKSINERVIDISLAINSLFVNRRYNIASKIDRIDRADGEAIYYTPLKDQVFDSDNNAIMYSAIIKGTQSMTNIMDLSMFAKRPGTIPFLMGVDDFSYLDYYLDTYNIRADGSVVGFNYGSVTINKLVNRLMFSNTNKQYSAGSGGISDVKISHHGYKYVLLNDEEVLPISSETKLQGSSKYASGLANIDVPMNVVVITHPSAIVHEVFVDGESVKFYSRQARNYLQLNFEIPTRCYNSPIRDVNVGIKFSSMMEVTAALQSRGEA